MNEKRLAFFALIFLAALAFVLFWENPVFPAQASWYGQESGRRTANGERFTSNDMTCAHRHYPFNTRLRVTDLKTGRSIVCRVNDRGPFVRGRDIDLSKEAARRLGIIPRGTASVQVQRLP